MPAFRNTTQVPAGGIVANIMAGSQFEFLARPTRVQVYQAQDPAAAPSGVGQSEVFFGQELELAQAIVPRAAAVDVGPDVPDQLVVDDIGAPGDRLVIRLQETASLNAATIRTLVNLTPL